MSIFKKQIEIIENSKITIINPKNLENILNEPSEKKMLLLTIDDGFSSFYLNAWPYLKKKKIPFIIFISTEAVGKNGYMDWTQIKEIQDSNIGVVGNHSHTHGYLVDLNKNEIEKDINRSIKIFNRELGFNPIFFSYPFGEFSLDFIGIIKNKFKFAFGQHSGVIDLSKDKMQLPRFPINEKYGDLDRFRSIINLLPFYYKNIKPEEKYLTDKKNPPKVLVEFFPEQKNLENISCYSNESNKWRKSKTFLKENNKLEIFINEKFTTERGRINCSLNDKQGWRWFGIQFTISKI